MAAIPNFRARTQSLEKARNALYREYGKVRKGCLGNPKARAAAAKWKDAVELELVLSFDLSLAKEQGALERVAESDTYKARIAELEQGIAKAHEDAKEAKAEIEAAMGV